MSAIGINYGHKFKLDYGELCGKCNAFDGSKVADLDDGMQYYEEDINKSNYYVYVYVKNFAENNHGLEVYNERKVMDDEIYINICN